MDAVYHFHQAGVETVAPGQDQVKGVCRMWAQTNQSNFFVEHEEVAVADHFITFVVTSYQQVSGKSLKEGKFLSSGVARTLLEKALVSNARHADGLAL